MESGTKQLPVRGNNHAANKTSRWAFPDLYHSSLAQHCPAITLKICQAIPSYSGRCPQPSGKTRLSPSSTYPIIHSPSHLVVPCPIKNWPDAPLRVYNWKQNMKNYQTNPFCEAELSYNYNGLCTKCTEPKGKTNPFRSGAGTLILSNFFAASCLCVSLCTAL